MAVIVQLNVTVSKEIKKWAKIRAAEEELSTADYIQQLVMEDVRKNSNLIERASV